jgi:DNA-binding protein H-NS
MSDLSLATKTLVELKEIIANAQAEADARLQAGMIAAFIELRNSAEQLNVSIEQIIQAGNEHGLSKFCENIKKSKKAAIKYRDPQDHSLTWSGRGLPPKWMQASLDKGWTRNDFLIADERPVVLYKKPLR